MDLHHTTEVGEALDHLVEVTSAEEWEIIVTGIMIILTHIITGLRLHHIKGLLHQEDSFIREECHHTIINDPIILIKKISTITPKSFQGKKEGMITMTVDMISMIIVIDTVIMMNSIVNLQKDQRRGE